MQGQKSHSFKLFLWKIIFVVGAGFFASFLGLGFNSNEASALFVPTLSASVDQANLQVNGNQVINSTDKTTEIPFNFTVNTNNRTGYTATLSSETENTALINAWSAVGAKIDSISTNLTLNNLPNNTWGYKFGGTSNYAPIPALSSPVQILQTTGKTNGNESNQLSIGMKLSNNLESGNYTNKLVISVISNPYERRAVMMTGKDFNRKVDSIVTSLSNDDGWGNKESVNHIRRSTASFNDIPAGAIDVENNEISDYPIKIWYDAASRTVFYWTEANKIILNKDSRYMFRGFTKTEDIDISDFDSSEVEDMAYFFYRMNSLQFLDLSIFNTEKVTDMTGMFAYANSLKKLDLSSFNTKNVINMTAMFFNNSALTSLDLSSFDTGNVKQMNDMFQGVSKVTTLRLNNFNTEKVENMSGMFAYMSELEDLDVSSFDTRRVTNMYGMFSGVKKIRNLNISNFNTNAVTNMGYIFTNMAALENLNVDNFNTSAVTNMNNMFSGMTNLRSLNLSNFDTRNVKDMGGMFHNMKTITELNLSSFNTSNVLGMEAMFYNMTALKTLDISNFDTSQVGSVKSIFATADGDSLERIYVNNDFNTARLTSYMDYTNMFTGRNKLRGGNGSYLSDPASADLTWLRVDRPGVQGYFTRKS